MWHRKKKYLLYLKGSHLVGVEWEKGVLRKVLDTSLDELFLGQEIAGEATLLLDREGLRHHIVSVPERGKISLKKMMAYEVESLMGYSPSELVYDWRMIGSSIEDGVPHSVYLLAAYPRPMIVSLLEDFSHQGIKVTKIISTLDLFIEKGKSLHTKGGSGLMVFEEPLVHFLFFRDGIYGFHRTFELRGDGFAKDLLLEIQRSFFYAKQKFKIPIEKMSILLAPEWLQGEVFTQLKETLSVPVDALSPKLSDCSFPEIKLLNIMTHELSLLPSLLNLLPTELMQAMEVRKISWAITFTEVVLLCLALLWTYYNRESLERDLWFSPVQEKQLQSVQARLEEQGENIALFKKLEEETSIVKNHLTKKRYLHLCLESFLFLVPENVHLESIGWGSSSSERPVTTPPSPSNVSQAKGANLITLNGKVDASSSDQRYSLFFQFANNLKDSPFVEKIEYQSEDLFTQGLFEITVNLKDIHPEE